MRLIDADALYAFLSDQREKETGMYSKGRNVGLNIARSALHDKTITPTIPIPTPPNPPLTLDELREMAGEPVWVVGADDDAIEGNGYAVVEFPRCDLPQVWWFGNEVEMMPLAGNYGKTWRAYRRKPEGPQ